MKTLARALVTLCALFSVCSLTALADWLPLLSGNTTNRTFEVEHTEQSAASLVRVTFTLQTGVATNALYLINTTGHTNTLSASATAASASWSGNGTYSIVRGGKVRFVTNLPGTYTNWYEIYRAER